MLQHFTSAWARGGSGRRHPTRSRAPGAVLRDRARLDRLTHNIYYGKYCRSVSAGGTASQEPRVSASEPGAESALNRILTSRLRQPLGHEHPVVAGLVAAA